MSLAEKTCPMSRDQVVDTYFMEHRAKLIDIAAFLDRMDRAAAGAEAGAEDFRMAAFRRALAVLADGDDQRAARVLGVFSDPTGDLPQSAHGMKGAVGAHNPAEKPAAEGGD